MSKIGIMGAMEEEIRLLQTSLQDKQVELLYGKSFFQGTLKGHEVILVEAGIGKVNASLITTLLIHHFGVELVINTGSAGAVSKDLSVGDLVIADEVVHHDVDLLAFGYQAGQMAGMPVTYQTHPDLVSMANRVAERLGQHASIGTVASGDQFINDKAMVQTIGQQFPLVKAVEMESAAIGQAAYVLGTPFLIIRSISDNADEDAGLSFEEFIVMAGRRSAQLVVALLEEIPTTNGI